MQIAILNEAFATSDKKRQIPLIGLEEQEQHRHKKQDLPEITQPEEVSFRFEIKYA